MKSKLYVIGIIAVLCVHSVMPAKVTVKLFKTNQGTWGRSFSYALEATKHTKKTKWSVDRDGIHKTVIDDEPVVLSSFKPLVKTGAITFDPLDSVNILIVAQKPNGKGNRHTLDLASHRKDQTSDWVVGIDKLAVPRSMTKAEVDQLIAQSAFPELISVAVFKRVKDGKKTTIRAIKSDDGEPDRAVVYSEITITKDTRGPLTKKLQVPLNQEFFIVVDDGRSQKLNNLQPDTILNIEADKKVTIEGVVENAERRAEEEALAAAKLNAQRAEKDARVAKERENKIKVARQKAKNELKRLETKEILAKGALRRATQGDLEQVDRLLTDKTALRNALIERLSQDPEYQEVVERISTGDQLAYGDYIRHKQLFLSLLQQFRISELETIQAQIQKLEAELADIPLFEATHINVPEAGDEE